MAAHVIFCPGNDELRTNPHILLEPVVYCSSSGVDILTMSASVFYYVQEVMAALWVVQKEKGGRGVDDVAGGSVGTLIPPSDPASDALPTLCVPLHELAKFLNKKACDVETSIRTKAEGCKVNGRKPCITQTSSERGGPNVFLHLDVCKDDWNKHLTSGRGKRVSHSMMFAYMLSSLPGITKSTRKVCKRHEYHGYDFLKHAEAVLRGESPERIYLCTTCLKFKSDPNKRRRDTRGEESRAKRRAGPTRVSYNRSTYSPMLPKPSADSGHESGIFDPTDEVHVDAWGSYRLPADPELVFDGVRVTPSAAARKPDFASPSKVTDLDFGVDIYDPLVDATPVDPVAPPLVTEAPRLYDGEARTWPGPQTMPPLPVTRMASDVTIRVTLAELEAATTVPL